LFAGDGAVPRLVPLEKIVAVVALFLLGHGGDFYCNNQLQNVFVEAECSATKAFA
jgi:hypothetical protein